MTYTSGEAAILTVLRADSNFDTTNTSRANWKLLNTGGSSGGEYVILRPDESAIQWITPTTYIARYVTVAEVWQRYTTETDSFTNLYTAVANVMTALMPERKLNTTVTDATVRRIPAPEYRWIEEGGPMWLVQEVAIEWTEETTVTFTD